MVDGGRAPLAARDYNPTLLSLNGYSPFTIHRSQSIMFLADLPEKQPALLSLIYTGGFALLALLLLVSLLFSRRRRRSALDAVAPADLPPEVRQRLGATSTNRGLRALRWGF